MAHGYIGDDYGIDGGINLDRDEEREHGWRDRDRDRGMMFGGAGWEEHGFGDGWERRQRFSANPDDHYRSWRDRHMSELDRDYREYCREREEQFHHDFDAWRQQRHANYQPLRTGMTNSGLSHDPSGQVQVETEAMTTENDPTDAATLGTNSSAGARSRSRR